MSLYKLLTSDFNSLILYSNLVWWTLLEPILPLSNLKPQEVIYLLNLSWILANEFLPPKSFQNWSLFKKLPLIDSYIILLSLSLSNIVLLFSLIKFPSESLL